MLTTRTQRKVAKKDSLRLCLSIRPLFRLTTSPPHATIRSYPLQETRMTTPLGGATRTTLSWWYNTTSSPRKTLVTISWNGTQVPKTSSASSIWTRVMIWQELWMPWCLSNPESLPPLTIYQRWQSLRLPRIRDWGEPPKHQAKWTSLNEAKGL